MQNVHFDDLYRIRNAEFRERLEHNADDFNQQDIGLQRQRQRPENVLQAQILPGDTLQALALRYNCTVRFGQYFVQCFCHNFEILHIRICHNFEK